MMAVNYTENQIVEVLSKNPDVYFTRQDLQDLINLQNIKAINEVLYNLLKQKRVERIEGIPPQWKHRVPPSEESNNEDEITVIFLDLDTIQDAVPRLSPYVSPNTVVYAFANHDTHCEGSSKDDPVTPTANYYLRRCVSQNDDVVFYMTWTAMVLHQLYTNKDKFVNYIIASRKKNATVIADLLSEESSLNRCHIATSTSELLQYVE
jgi:hypothetical protein